MMMYFLGGFGRMTTSSESVKRGACVCVKYVGEDIVVKIRLPFHKKETFFLSICLVCQGGADTRVGHVEDSVVLAHEHITQDPQGRMSMPIMPKR